MRSWVKKLRMMVNSTAMLHGRGEDRTGDCADYLCADCRRLQLLNCLAACKVFCISMAMVIGPTPPGTGVMAAHNGATSS